MTEGSPELAQAMKSIAAIKDEPKAPPSKYKGPHVSNKLGPDGKPIERFYHIHTPLLYLDQGQISEEQADALETHDQAEVFIRAVRGTVFFRREDNGWFAAVARCSPRDNPCRETGRNVARRRYFRMRDRHGLGRDSKAYLNAKIGHLYPAGPFDAPSYEIAKRLYEAL